MSDHRQTDAVSIITPTGDRPECLGLLGEFIRRQTFTGRLQWIVVDDGEFPFDPTPNRIDPLRAAEFELYYHRRDEPDVPGESLNRNLITALRLARHGKIVMMEDDDWYSPHYVATLAGWLDRYELAGEGQARYYNVRLRKYRQLANRDRASLCQTGWRSALNAQIDRCCRTGNAFVDLRIWKLPVRKFVSRARGLSIGIKGMPGRSGYGIGHRPSSDYRDDGSGAQLQRWVGEDFPQYRDYYETPIPRWWDWIRRQPRETRWCLVGKGPSFAAAAAHPDILAGRKLIGLNHVCREWPVDVTHAIDLEVVDELGETLWERGGTLVMPWHPHRGNAPRRETLAEWVAQRPLLQRLRAAGRLVTYHLDHPDHNRLHTRPPGEPAVGVRYFSAEAACNLLLAAGVGEIATLGIDGGSGYAAAFEDLPALRNGRKSFDRQFGELERVAKLHAARIVPLARPDATACEGAMERDRLAFVHIPKTAGTSVHNALASHYQGRRHALYQLKDRTLTWKWPAYISGHLPASELTAKYPGCRLVTCIRHPVDRLVSLWRFWHAEIDKRLRDGKPFVNPDRIRFHKEQPTIEEFAADRRNRGETGLLKYLDVPIARFDWILRFDSLQEDWREMLKAFGLPEITLLRQNVTPSSVATPEFDRARVEKILSEEISFYERVVEHIES